MRTCHRQERSPVHSPANNQGALEGEGVWRDVAAEAKHNRWAHKVTLVGTQMNKSQSVQRETRELWWHQCFNVLLTAQAGSCHSEERRSNQPDAGDKPFCTPWSRGLVLRIEHSQIERNQLTLKEHYLQKELKVFRLLCFIPCSRKEEEEKMSVLGMELRKSSCSLKENLIHSVQHTLGRYEQVSCEDWWLKTFLDWKANNSGY